MTAYAAPDAAATNGADAAIVPAAEQIDTEATGSTRVSKPKASFTVAPMPPVRPASFGRDEASSAPKPPMRRG
jgi:hypothetical protein